MAMIYFNLPSDHVRHWMKPDTWIILLNLRNNSLCLETMNFLIFYMWKPGQYNCISFVLIYNLNQVDGKDRKEGKMVRRDKGKREEGRKYLLNA